jgi:hypothetical protein
MIFFEFLIFLHYLNSANQKALYQRYVHLQICVTIENYDWLTLVRKPRKHNTKIWSLGNQYPDYSVSVNWDLHMSRFFLESVSSVRFFKKLHFFDEKIAGYTFYYIESALFTIDAHKHACTLTSMNVRTQTLSLWASLKDWVGKSWGWRSHHRAPLLTGTSPTTERIAPNNPVINPSKCKHP